MEKQSPVKEFFSFLGRKGDELKEYDEMMEYLASEHKGFMVSSSGPSRAAISSKHLVQKAKKVIRIFTSEENFQEDGMYADMAEWLNDGVSVMIYCENGIGVGMMNPPENILVKTATSHFKDAVTKRYKGLCHFITIDDVAYRREYDTNHHIGVLDFNDPEKTGKLIALFDGHFNGSFRPKRTFWERLQGN